MNRSQCVKVNGHKSEYMNIYTGVPQGSILGPILFILFINDFPLISDQSKMFLYADDTTICLSDSNYDSLVGKVNAELVKVGDWIADNKLSMNIGKSCWMLVTTKTIRQNIEQDVSFNNVPLKLCEQAKSLGVIFDNNLSFKPHINYIVGKISKIVGIFYKLKPIVPKEILINLYYSLVYPHLTYCILIWGGTYRTHLSDIELLQKKLVRLITNSEYLAHSKPLFYQTGILNIFELYEYHLGIFAFKNKSKFHHATHNYSTRNAELFVPCFSRLSISQRTIWYAAPNFFNSLPTELKECRSLGIFKKKCKTYLLNRYRPEST